MSKLLKTTTRWWTVVIFAVAMAWVEAAVVYYLRTMVNRIVPYQPEPLPIIGNLGLAELVRELATLIMILMVGVLAGSTWRKRLGFAAVAFGIWDIFYYIFLKGMCGWPHSVLDWDILFLLPLPWWGPVLAPVSIALLMVAWGTLAGHVPEEIYSNPNEWKWWALNLMGIALALYIFMADSLQVAGQGANVVRNVLPASFPWGFFAVALLMMSAPVVQLARSVPWRDLPLALRVSSYD